MEPSSPETYILAVPGTNETRELSRGSLLAGLARGEFTPQHWLWSPADHDWKQVADFPELQPKSRIPAFVPAAIAPIEPVTPVPPIRTGKDAPKKKAKVKPRRTNREREGSGIPYFQILFALVYVAVAAIIALNYVYVDEPFDGKLAKTAFVLVPAHAHLGSFVQQNALIIHVLPNHEVNGDNLGEFLATLAQSTPPQPFKAKPFDMIDLTSAWVGQFAFQGNDWTRLGLLEGSRPEELKDFVVDHVADISGRPLIPEPGKLSPPDLQTARNQVWQSLVTKLLRQS